MKFIQSTFQANITIYKRKKPETSPPKPAETPKPANVVRKRKISSETRKNETEKAAKRKKPDSLENVTKRIKANEAQRKTAKQIQTFDLHQNMDMAAEPTPKKNGHQTIQKQLEKDKKTKSKTVSG